MSLIEAALRGNVVKKNNPPLYLLFLTQGLILLAITLGDAWVLSGRPASISKTLWALTDEPVHLLLGILISWPLAWSNGWNRQSLRRITLAGLSSVLIDVDHILAAGSLSLFDITTLPFRPATHSLAFALICSLVIFLFTRDLRDGVLVLTALASHLLRDASGGATPFLLWPFYSARLPMEIYYAAEILLSMAAWVAMIQYASRHSARFRRSTDFKVNQWLAHTASR